MKTFARIVSAPFLGLIFFLALPVISVSLIAYTLCERIYAGLKVSASRMLYFSWKPSEAYLSGNGKKERKSKQGGEVC